MATSSIPRTSGIYKITCTANGKIYVGSSDNLRRRWTEHQNNLRENRHHNLPLQRAWNKYGESTFVFAVLELVMPWSILDREQYWIDELKPYDKSIGFNLAVRADSPMAGRKASNETRVKISKAVSGIKRSPETRQRMSISQKGKSKGKGIKKSPEHRAKISASNKGKHQIGHKPTPETIEKLRKSKLGNTWNRGRKRSPEAVEQGAEKRRKTYIVINPEGVEWIIKGLAKFCREQGLDIVGMCAVLSGKQKHHRGWKCKHV